MNSKIEIVIIFIVVLSLIIFGVIKYMEYRHITITDLEIKHNKIMAENGDLKAQIYLGNLYLKGLNTGSETISQNPKESLVWYKMAAEQGDMNAQYIVGRLYYYHLRNSSASNNDILESCFSGIDFDYSLPESKDDAILWLNKSAEQGNINAQWMLGDIYLSKLPLSKDDIKEATK